MGADDALILEGEIDRIVREVHERLEKAGLFPNITRAPIPPSLRRTVFGLAYKSGVQEWTIGFPRSEDNRMLIIAAHVSYTHVQAERWTYKVRLERRSMRREYVNKQGQPDVQFIGGRSSERILVVGTDEFADSFERTSPKRQSSDDSLPECWPDAEREIRSYSVQFHRMDRLPFRMEFPDIRNTPIEIGVATALAKVREQPRLVEPMQATQKGPGDVPGDLDGSINDALMRARQDASRGGPRILPGSEPYLGGW